MKLLNITQVKARLSFIIERVMNKGEEFLIGKGGKPVAKIVRHRAPRKNSRLGLFAGKIKIGPDFEEWPEDIKKLFS